MFGKNFVESIVGGFYTQCTAEMDKYVEAYTKSSSAVEKLKGSADDIKSVITGFQSGIDAIIKGTEYEGLRVEEFISLIYFYETDDKPTSISLTIRSAPKFPVAFKIKENIDINEATLVNIAGVYKVVIAQLAYSEFASLNVTELNKYFDKVTTDAGVSYKIKFAVSDDFVTGVTDTEVTFGVSVGSALELGAMTAFVNSDNEFSQYRAEELYKNLVDTVKALETTPQVIKANIPLIVDITGVKTRKRADKLIRKICHRQAKNLKDVKVGVGYYSETVKVNDEDVDVFSLVEKTADGEIVTVLAPFDVATNFTVDFDVVSAVKSEIA